MARPEKKVHIPLDFKEALRDLLKVKPDDDGERDEDDASEETDEDRQDDSEDE
jgi:hypothetical protein